MPGNIVSCPEETIRIELSDPNGIDSFTVQLYVEEILYTTTDPNLWFDPSTNTLTFVPPDEFANGQTVDVILADVRDTLGNGLSSPLSFTFQVDLVGPYVVSTNPTNLSYVNTLTPTIEMELVDDLAGVDVSSVHVLVRNRGIPYHYYYGSPVLEVAPGLLTIDLSNAVDIRPEHGDTLHICLLEANDLALYCGRNPLQEDSVCVDVILDVRGPEATLISPADGSISACSLQTISIQLEDDLPIQPYSILLQINEESYTVDDPHLTFYPTTGELVFQPTEPFGNGEDVFITLAEADDSLGNTLESVPTWAFTVDRGGPYMVWHDPSTGSSTASPHPTVSMLFDDTLDNIMHSSAVISLIRNPIFGTPETLRVNNEMGMFSWNEDTLVFNTTAISFEDADTVWICVDSLTDSTLYCEPNNIQGNSCFWFVMSFSGPSLSVIAPPDNGYIPCDSSAILVRIFDRDGVVESSIRITVDGDSYALGVYPYMTYSDNILVFWPSDPWDPGRTITVSVDSAQDLLGNDLSEPLEWSFTIDMTPPEVREVYPPPSGVISNPSPIIRAFLYDDLSGIARNSLYFVVADTDTFVIGEDPGIYWRGDTACFDTDSVGVFFTGGSEADVCVGVRLIIRYRS